MLHTGLNGFKCLLVEAHGKKIHDKLWFCVISTGFSVVMARTEIET